LPGFRNRKSKYKFKASDGEHEADLDFNGGIVSLRMNDVKEVKDYHGDFILDTPLSLCENGI
jgi:diaminopimelate epimerase